MILYINTDDNKHFPTDVLEKLKYVTKGEFISLIVNIKEFINIKEKHVNYNSNIYKQIEQFMNRKVDI